MKSLALVFVALMVVGGCAPQEPATSTATHFHGMRLIPGDGSAAIENAAMLVDGGEILAVGGADAVEAPAGAAHVDLSGRTVMPLLHSLHVHVGYLKGSTMAAENYTRESILDDLNRYAHYGVGSVLVVGTDVGDTAFEIREDQRQGRAGRARLFTVGRGLTSKGGYPIPIGAIKAAPQQIETEEEAREAVRGLAVKNVDAIKIWVDDRGGQIPKITPELYGAAIDEAKKNGIPVVAHVFYLDDAKELVEAGVSGFIHSVRDQEVDDELIEMMKENDVFYLPTLTAHQAPIAYADQPGWIGEAAMRETVSSSVIETLTSEEFVEEARNDPALPGLREQYQTALTNLKKLSEAGVTIAFGTDSGTTNRFPGYFEHRELEEMVAAGLSPAETITAATKTSAEILGVEGTLIAGSPADFMVLGRDPLTDIRGSRDIEAVYMGGEVVDRPIRPTSD